MLNDCHKPPDVIAGRIHHRRTVPRGTFWNSAPGSTTNLACSGGNHVGDRRVVHHRSVKVHARLSIETSFGGQRDNLLSGHLSVVSSIVLEKDRAHRLTHHVGGGEFVFFPVSIPESTAVAEFPRGEDFGRSNHDLWSGTSQRFSCFSRVVDRGGGPSCAGSLKKARDRG